MNPLFTPAVVLREYAWQVLKLNDPEVWDEQNYGGMVPIVPVAEEADMSQYSGPLIVYGYALSATGTIVDHASGSMTFAIYDTSNRRLNHTINVLKTAFERRDETAARLNEHSTALGSDWVGLRFTSVWVGFIEGGSPEQTEGGRQSGLININFNYVADYDVVLPPKP